jgi:hypothetical protein
MRSVTGQKGQKGKRGKRGQTTFLGDPGSLTATSYFPAQNSFFGERVMEGSERVIEDVNTPSEGFLQRA